MTDETYITVRNTRFMIERAKDFDDSGKMTNGRGWFLNLVSGGDNTANTILSGGMWFEYRSQAESAAWRIASE